MRDTGEVDSSHVCAALIPNSTRQQFVTITLPSMNDFGVLIDTDLSAQRLLEEVELSVCGQVELIHLKQGTSGVSNCSSGKHLPC